MTALTILSSEIRQSDNLYSLNDLHKASGSELRHRPVEFLRLDQTKELIAEIVNGGDPHLLPVKTEKGRNGGTYVCKELVYSYAMWISAKFSLLVIRAFDALQSSSNPLQLPNLITTAQAGELATLIAERFPDGRKRPYAWGRFNNHFRLSGYKTLPASKFDEACAYIRQMEDKDKPATSGEAPTLKWRKFLVSYDGDGKEHVSHVPDDAGVMSKDQFVKAVCDPNGFVLTSEQYAALITACAANLAQQCKYFKKSFQNLQEQMKQATSKTEVKS